MFLNNHIKFIIRHLVPAKTMAAAAAHLVRTSNHNSIEASMLEHFIAIYQINQQHNHWILFALPVYTRAKAYTQLSVIKSIELICIDVMK